MSRQWKRGELAMVRSANGDWHRSWVEHKNPGDGNLVFAHDGGGFVQVRTLDADRVRPLVVIDPEDREQVGRLTRTMMSNGWSGIDHEAVDDMQQVLRELANPTSRIQEPMGLGAVVEDVEGRHFTLCCDCGCDKRWRVTQAVDGAPGHCWSDLNIVRVLSEGVTE